jgi:hypothetical protein
MIRQQAPRVVAVQTLVDGQILADGDYLDPLDRHQNPQLLADGLPLKRQIHDGFEKESGLKLPAATGCSAKTSRCSSMSKLS